MMFTTPSPGSDATATPLALASAVTISCTSEEALAAQTDDAALAARFAPLAQQLADNEQTIVAELAAVQGKPVDIGGYYLPDFEKLAAVMRPSQTLNAVLAAAQG